ncbi:hypothetical protein C6A85_14430, partial [Mycobacterium sp. ITM-2017-0098]
PVAAVTDRLRDDVVDGLGARHHPPPRAHHAGHGGHDLASSRTKTIDDIITKAISDGCDRVLNLAAGLDTRPYRLNLPAEFG